jgi:hypothetical protein
MAGDVELSGSVIESPQGLHSKAYKFSAKARLMICKIIGLPQIGQATLLLGIRFSLIGYLCMQWRNPTLTRIKKVAVRASPWPLHTSRHRPVDAPALKWGIDIITSPGQMHLLDLIHVKAASFHLFFYVVANRKLAKIRRA